MKRDWKTRVDNWIYTLSVSVIGLCMIALIVSMVLSIFAGPP